MPSITSLSRFLETAYEAETQKIIMAFPLLFLLSILIGSVSEMFAQTCEIHLNATQGSAYVWSCTKG
jgi:hypothetical protein